MGLFLSENNELMVLTYHRLAAFSYTVYFQIRRDGKVIKNRMQYYQGSGIGKAVISMPFIDGDELLNLSVIPNDATITAGTFLVAIYVMDKGVGINYPIYKLAEGPCDVWHPLCYPDSTLSEEYKDYSALINAQGTTTGTAFQTFGATNAVFKRIIAGTIQITTDATLANRQVFIEGYDGQPQGTYYILSNLIVTASQVKIIAFGINPNAGITPTTQDYIWIPDIWLNAQVFFRVGVVGGVAGDSILTKYTYQERLGITTLP